MFKKIALLVACVLSIGTASATPTEYVVNGDFSNGLFGWTTNSNAYGTNGAYEEGAVGFDAVLQQTIVGNVGESLLQFDFGGSWYQYVLWNGVDISGQLTGAVQHYSYSVVATGNDLLQFFGRNDPSYNFLDNVSVTNVPEPASLALVGLGLLGVMAARRKQA